MASTTDGEDCLAQQPVGSSSQTLEDTEESLRRVSDRIKLCDNILKDLNDLHTALKVSAQRKSQQDVPVPSQQ